MKTGAAISGLGHAAVIAVILIGLPWFPRRERPPIPVTEVSFVSEADFERAQAAAKAPREEEAPPEQPRARPATPEAPPEPDPAPEPEAAPEAEPAPEAPAAEPEAATLAPSFDPDAPLAAPSDAPAISAMPAPDAPSAVAPPRARITPPRAPAPSPLATPEPTEEPAPLPPAPEPAQAAPAQAEPEPAPAPEPPATLALESAARPLTRRGNMETAAARPAETPRETPPETQPETPPETPARATPPETPEEAPARPSDLVRQLREEVEREPDRRAGATPPTEPTPPSPPSAGTAPSTSLPTGPPITNSERNGLVLAVQKCWNLPAGLRDAGELKVTLAAELNPDGSIVSGSVRLLEPDPAPDPRFRQAYEAGRRALLRCAPYSNLPREKYAQWREIEVVFNPEGMVSW